METITSTRPAILQLGDPAGSDAGLVGGKAANLSRLATRYRVPPGFSLTAAAYDPAQSPGAPLERLIATQVAAAYRVLSRDQGVPDIPVAVRSSALDEDGDLVSFAGQHETEL